jgi:histidyl-tRNA synthetase
MSMSLRAKGTRDFLPPDVRRRDFVINVIRRIYERYGFEPLETPALENVQTLLGRYGEENNKLIFKILRRGVHEASNEPDLALRYDLTVPLARVYVEHLHELSRSFFKRYQIQPVWRADKPGRGRFREFYQCDIDSIGSASPIVEAEQITAVSEILRTLGFQDCSVRLNHRGVLSGMLAWAEVPETLHSDALISLDKKDKIGIEGVRQELIARGVSESSAERLLSLTSFLPAALDPKDEINNLRRQIGSIPVAAAALDNLETIVQLSSAAAPVILDKSLARGLSYYTGAIMEISVHDLPGSLGGGGRYDNLINVVTTSSTPGAVQLRHVPACGFSLGLERILVVMQERGMFPPEIEQSSIDVVVAATDKSALEAVVETATALRQVENLRVDIYPDVARKLEKIFRHVDHRRAKFIAILGTNEVAEGTVSVRNVATRTQETMPRTEVASFIRRALSD